MCNLGKQERFCQVFDGFDKDDKDKILVWLASLEEFASSENAKVSDFETLEAFAETGILDGLKQKT
jgi:hypothetical protein